MPETRELFEEAASKLDGEGKLQRHDVLALFGPAIVSARDEGCLIAELEYETIAAELCLYDEVGRWGTFHGPWASGINAEGETIDSPPLESITPECINYWRGRMTAAKRPATRARYADLVWEFCKQVTGAPPPIEAARLAIEGYVEAVTAETADAFAGLGDPQLRALRLAASINDQGRLTNAVGKFRQLASSPNEVKEREYRQRVLIGQLGELRGKFRPKAALQSLASDLRSRLDELVAENADQFTIGNVAHPLADYLWSEQKREECLEVLGILGDAVRRDAKSAMGVLAVAWLSQLRDVYLKHDMVEDAAEILRAIESRQSEVPDNLLPISIPHQIDQGELDKWLDWLVDDDTQASTWRLLGQFIAGVDEAREQLKKVQNDFPLSQLFTSNIVDHQGRSVAEVGPADSDEEGALVRHLHQGMQFSDCYLAAGLCKLFEIHFPDADTLANAVISAPVWHRGRHAILRRAIVAYYDDDPIVCIHLLVAEIENAIRSIAGSRGVVLQKPNRYGGYDLKNLSDFLASPELISFLGEDVATYLRVVLTDRRGWNLRNNTCHGLVPASSLSSAPARRLMHIVLLLSQVRTGSVDKSSTAADASSATPDLPPADEKSRGTTGDDVKTHQSGPEAQLQRKD